MITDFNDIAHIYDAEIPEHIRAYLVRRKIRMMLPYFSWGFTGVDIGCGHGWHVELLNDTGLTVVGVDSSPKQIARTRDVLGRYVVAEAQHLPFKNRTFDFAFFINVLHHVEPSERSSVLEEAFRVVKPGGLVIIHEINPRNPFFRWYMDHVFCRLHRIDDGSEVWLWPPHETVEYYGWIPEWTPRFLFPSALRVQKWFEKSFLKKYSSHYMAVMRKPW